jgi:hypothetical protein
MQGMSKRIFVFILLAIAAAANSAMAQIIYEPIQYQFGDQNKFYYGGTDARVFERAAAPSDAGAQWGRIDGYDFASGDIRVHREVGDQPARVYSDALPAQNAALYGFTATDAANVANASMPRYFRKADVLAAERQSPGLLIVPARAILAPGPAQSSVRPPATTQPLMILPLPSAPQNAPPPSDKLALASH